MNCLPFFRWQPWLKVSLVVLLLVFLVSVYAFTVDLDTSDAVGSSSFASSLNGSNTTAPTSGNACFTGAFTLRTTDAAGTAQTFAGASLSVDSGGSLAFKTDGPIAINNLTLHGGTLAQVGFTGATTATIAGTSMSIAADSFINDQTSGRILVIQSAMSGVGGLTIKSSSTSGGGAAVFSANNTYTGATTVSTGLLNIQNANALGTTAAGTCVTSGAALQLQGGITTDTEALTLNWTGITSTGALRNISGTNAYAGLVTLGAATRTNSDAGTLTMSNTGTITGATFGLTVSGAGNTMIASIIGTASGTLTKDGAGTLSLSGANTFTGAKTVSVGALNIQNANAPGTVAGAISVSRTGFSALVFLEE